ncbi:hypothetical protein FOZ63_022982, partial [Perkinsus olseni]
GLGAPLHTAASDPSFRYMASSPNMRRNMSSCSLVSAESARGGGPGVRSPWSLISPTESHLEGTCLSDCEYEPTPQLVFVYGTLKRGCRNQKYMLPRGGSDDIVFVSAAQTAIPYPMIYDANYFFPYLLDIPGAGLLVEGEIYKVSPSKLKELDILEGCPRRYERRTMAIAPYDHKALERLMPDVYEEAVKVLAAANAEVGSSQSSDCPPSPGSSPISKQKKRLVVQCQVYLRNLNLRPVWNFDELEFYSNFPHTTNPEDAFSTDDSPCVIKKGTTFGETLASHQSRSEGGELSPRKTSLMARLWQKTKRATARLESTESKQGLATPSPVPSVCQSAREHVRDRNLKYFGGATKSASSPP